MFSFFGQPISFDEEWGEGDRGNISSKVSSNTFHKGQIKVFLHFRFNVSSFKYHKIFLRVHVNFYVRLFHSSLAVVVSQQIKTRHQPRWKRKRASQIAWAKCSVFKGASKGECCAVIAFGFCGVCGTEPDVVVGAVEEVELVAGLAAWGTWKGTAIFDWTFNVIYTRKMSQWKKIRDLIKTLSLI